MQDPKKPKKQPSRTARPQGDASHESHESHESHGTNPGSTTHGQDAPWPEEAADLRALVRAAPVALGALDTQLRFLYMNERMASLSSVEADESCPHPHLTEAFPSLAAKLHPDLLRTLEAHGSIVPVQFQTTPHETPQTEIHCLALFSSNRGPEGEALGMSITIQDITRQKQLEQEHQATEERLHQAAKIGKIVIYEWDLVSGKVIKASGLDEILGPHAFPGTATVENWREKVHPEDLREILRKAEKHMFSDEGYDDEYRILNSENQYIYIWDRGTVIRDEHGQPSKIIGVSIDIDARKKLEAELQRHTQTLAEADRRKDEFIAMLSHELRNPLTPINAAVATLRLLKSNDEVASKAIALISRQAAHMSRIVHDLLDVSRMTKGALLIQKKRLDLTALLGDTIADYRDSIEAAGLLFQGSLPDHPVWIDGDETRLTQAFGNVLHNASKFTPPGGSIRLALSTDPDKRAALVTIQDTGTGIPAKFLPHIFDGFSQGPQSIDRTKGGLGLGLAIVKSVIEKHDGEVAAFSAGPDRGARFDVTLPLAELDTTPEGAPRQTSTCEGRARRILIIEDQPDILAALELFIREILGLEVSTANDARAGLERARELRPDFIICDIGLPGEMNGYDLAKAIRTTPETSALKLIALTGYGTEADKKKCREAGFDLHMAKPPDPDKLQEILTGKLD